MTAMLPREFEITDLRWETGEGDVFTWALEPRDGGGFAYSPGQFTMLYRPGVGEVPISISGGTASGALVQMLRAVGSVSRVLQGLRPGDRVGVRGPFGSSWPIAEAQGKDLLIVAGGIGLAPLRPVVRHVLRHRAQFERVYLLYGTRTPLDILYRGELEQWQLAGAIDVRITVDRARPGWNGRVGVVPRLLEHCTFDPSNALAMVCGPEIMMRFTELSMARSGMDTAQVFISMERNMQCAIGHCGHCQYGPHFVCKDGPVFRMSEVAPFFEAQEH